MPSRKISELTRKTNLTGDELVPAAHAGETYAVSISSIKSSVTKNDIGLSNVDNTPDVDKPVSALIQQALDGKAESTHGHAISDIVDLLEVLEYKSDTTHEHSEYAPVDSPILTGTPLAPTAATDTDSEQIATTAFVKAVVGDVTIADASTTVAGKVMLAISGDVESIDKAVTPLMLNEVVSNLANASHDHEGFAPTIHTHTGDQIASPTTVEIINVSDLTYNLTLNDAGKLIRFISPGVKAINISIADVPANYIFHIANRSPSGSGDLTLSFGNGIVGNVPKNGTLILEPCDTVSVHFASAVSADIYGSTKAV